MCYFFFSSRRRHTRFKCDWSSDVCSSDLPWLPFSGWGVYAVDMASPAAAPVTLDSSSNVGGLRLVQRGTYDPASGAVSGVGPYAAIWIAGGKIWRASATAGGTPAVAQVSSEANVGDPSVPGKRVAAIQ